MLKISARENAFKNGLDRKFDNRQVPKENMKTDLKTILIVGSGRLATHLNHWVNLQNSDFTNSKILNWDRGQDPHLIRTFIQQADFIWLAISDSALVSFYEKYLLGFDHFKVVHFSGALHDPRMICAHPLMTFGSETYSDEIYKKIQFAITGCEKLSEALPGFQNQYFTLPAEQKPLYHALCVVSGNLPQLLWIEASKVCHENKIPFSAFELLMRQSLENLLLQGEKALTGPFARHDINTIEKNKAALPESLKNIYSQFQKEFLK